MYGRDHGTTANLCPRESVIFVVHGLTMRDAPPSWWDRRIMNEGKKMGAVDFYIGGDINIELELEDSGEDLQGLDGIDWYGMHGPECRGGGEDVITYEKNLGVHRY